ncbi:BrnA antitoxin family protein [Gluconobacter kondonii]|mgnify:CR=1 FL=1|uniref:BrnA antitoxin family protein n=1 Tax=Gluconobacter TaxID=441 RepID=UPI00192066C6|nr:MULTISPECIES: BrnA antitoxin family protein [Gluconobacter]MCP1237096.1 BrnA antitoxin family protein [Gluconobacter kondonii]QQX92708.1 BrnA antitoxin family protein [Gluconobacter sphaericus]
MKKKNENGKPEWVDPDEIPELGDDFFLHADVWNGDKLVKRGRPRVENPKKQVTLRLDADIIDAFKSQGSGWQTRMNEALRQAINHHG